MADFSAVTNVSQELGNLSFVNPEEHSFSNIVMLPEAFMPEGPMPLDEKEEIKLLLERDIFSVKNKGPYLAFINGLKASEDAELSQAAVNAQERLSQLDGYKAKVDSKQITLEDIMQLHGVDHLLVQELILYIVENNVDFMGVQNMFSYCTFKQTDGAPDAINELAKRYAEVVQNDAIIFIPRSEIAAQMVQSDIEAVRQLGVTLACELMRNPDVSYNAFQKAYTILQNYVEVRFLEIWHDESADVLLRMMAVAKLANANNHLEAIKAVSFVGKQLCAAESINGKLVVTLEDPALNFVAYQNGKILFNYLATLDQLDSEAKEGVAYFQTFLDYTLLSLAAMYKPEIAIAEADDSSIVGAKHFVVAMRAWFAAALRVGQTTQVMGANQLVLMLVVLQSHAFMDDSFNNHFTLEHVIALEQLRQQSLDKKLGMKDLDALCGILDQTAKDLLDYESPSDNEDKQRGVRIRAACWVRLLVRHFERIGQEDASWEKAKNILIANNIP